MNNPIMVWCVIAGVLLCAFVFRTVVRNFGEWRGKSRNAKPVVEMGKERDIFFIPGDVEDNDFEDL